MALFVFIETNLLLDLLAWTVLNRFSGTLHYG